MLPNPPPTTNIHLRPVGEKIIVLQEPDVERRSEGGVYMPQNMKERSKRGKVMAVGKGRIRENGVRVPPDVSVGDVIVFGAYSGSEIDPTNKLLVSLVEHDIIAVIDEA